jgi:two-component system sensor histidine kinase HydH
LAIADGRFSIVDCRDQSEIVNRKSSIDNCRVPIFSTKGRHEGKELRGIIRWPKFTGAKPPPPGPHLGFVLLLGLLALSLAGVTLLSYRSAVETAEALLRGQAMDLALALEADARRGGGERAALQAMLEEHRGSGVAYAALLARDGTILAHTNPRLVGGRLEDGRLAAAVTLEREQTGRVELQTGEDVFEATIPIHASRAAGAPWFLRVALHTAVAERGVRYAEAQGAAVAAILILLAALTVRQVRAARRAVALERLAALGEMAAVLAHEIRNPLGAIKGLAQVLDERARAASQDRELTETIVRETVRLERLVADLLAYARPRPPDRRPVDVAALARRAADLLAAEASAAGARIALEAPAYPVVALADAGQLTQLFTNLLLNALQAMPRGGAVEVRVGREKEAVVVTVADEGSGIAPQEAARLFDPFYTTKPNGTGLGLAICRRVAEAHGGRIALEEHTGPGARLRVELPAAAPRAEAARPSAAAGEGSFVNARGGEVSARGTGAVP